MMTMMFVEQYGADRQRERVTAAAEFRAVRLARRVLRRRRTAATREAVSRPRENLPREGRAEATSGQGRASPRGGLPRLA